MKKLAALLVLALAAFALVACGGDDDSDTTAATTDANGGAAAEGGEEAGGGGGGSTVDFEADPNGELAYTTDSATAEAGEVTIDFKNPQSLTHDVVIEDQSGEDVGATELIGEGETSETINLKPGKYTFYCSVPGHREAGMEGTLTVE
ncbi:MAG TPA: plastocyanin/azurin family copper-binding protein [Solirubrobacterales bacterium]|nr:plastocyanin/azurin family copper-binding protein [Solirubrobacterales bacterium]